MQDASYFDGQSAEEKAVRLAATPHGIRFVLSRQSAQISKGDVSIEDQGEGVLRIRVSDSGAYFILRSTSPRAWQEAGFPGRYKKNFRQALLYASSLLAAVGILGGLFYHSLTPFSSWLAQKVPFDIEQKMFQSVVMHIIGSDACENPEVQTSLNHYKDQILSQVDPELAPKIVVSIVDWPDKNAFALPGGRVVFTKAALRAKPEEIVAVLAHEIAHVRERHVLGSYIKATVFTWFMAVLAGDYLNGIVIDPAVVTQLIQLGFSRDVEREADQLALEYLDQSGFQHDPLASFLEKLLDESEAESSDLVSFLSTHPAVKERAATIRSYQRRFTQQTERVVMDWSQGPITCQ